ncbi:MAG: sulfite exporter TauE/SafE family protein [Actinobacteria bacterium]|nr:MAG: sulfite exporter TauE/SafE family protein [Actinomycetota bacterium]
MDPILALAGLGVGIVVGLTGMGGGALMTPILVLVFGIPPVAAVSSDLAASAVMKPFGGLVHARRGTVLWPVVGWLCVGSVPSAFLGVLLLRLIGSDATVQRVIQVALAVALLLAAGGLVAKAYRGRRDRAGDKEPAAVRVRPLPTALLGAAGGLVVGLTSVGSGSLIIVVLLMLYFFGDLHLDIAAAVLIGSIPGVLIGARLSSRAPNAVVRAALVVVLVASALKLFGLSNLVVAGTAGAVALAAVVLTLRGRVARPVPVAVEDPALN